MTPITQSSRQRYNQAGSLAEELPYWGWVDKRTLLTRPGGLVTLAELHPCGIAGSSPEDLDHTLSSWMRLLGQLDEDVRFSLIVTRRPVQPGAVASIGNEQLPDAIFQSRADQIIQRSGELRFFAAWTLDAKIQESHSKGGFAASWLKRLTSNGKTQRRFILESITRSSERLQRIVDASRGLITEVSPSSVLEEKEATAAFGDLINRPGTMPPVHEGGALHWAWGLSQLDGHRNHLTLDDEPLAIYSLLEPPPKATANILWDLLTLRATWTYVWEWQGLSTGKARGIIRSAQKHFFSSRYSMMAHARGTEGTDAALVDSAAAAESAALGDALVELQTDGIPWGKLAASLSIHAPDLQQLEELDSSIIKIFTGRDIKILREGYGQLSTWFARLPGQSASRQLRRMPVSSGTALCCSPIFSPGKGDRRIGPPRSTLSRDARNPLRNPLRLRPLRRFRRRPLARAWLDRSRQELPSQFSIGSRATLQPACLHPRPRRELPQPHRHARRQLPAPRRHRHRNPAAPLLSSPREIAPTNFSPVGSHSFFRARRLRRPPATTRPKYAPASKTFTGSRPISAA